MCGALAFAAGEVRGLWKSDGDALDAFAAAAGGGSMSLMNVSPECPPEYRGKILVITNADHIRSMTDEELAKKIIVLQQQAIYFVCRELGYNPPPPEEINDGDFKSSLEWLKQPYKENT